MSRRPPPSRGSSSSRGESSSRAGGRSDAAGASQRQLRAGELVRHSLAEILRESEVADPRLQGVSVTVTEVRVSPDLRHATCFVEPLGGVRADVVVDGLNHASRFLRGQLGRSIELRFTPDLHFVHDPSFSEAAHMNALFNRPEVRRDLEAAAHDDEPEGAPGGAPGRDASEEPA